MGRLWIIRHGQASFGSSNYDALSDRGLHQATLLGRHLAQCRVNFQAAFSGTQKRQTETGFLVFEAMQKNFPGTGLGEQAEFNEYDFMAIIQCLLPQLLKDEPKLEPDVDQILTDHGAFQRIFSRIVTRWVAGTHDTPGVETFKEYTRRVGNGIKAILEQSPKNADLILFTSGGVISSAMQTALNLSDHETMLLGWQIKNASITVLCHDGKRLYLETFNSVAHLECAGAPDMVTYR